MERKWKKVYERLPIERKDKSLTEISGFTNFCSDPQVFNENVTRSRLTPSDRPIAVRINNKQLDPFGSAPSLPRLSRFRALPASPQSPPLSF